mgnify:FL=1
MTTHAQAFMKGFVKGVLSPVTVLASMYGMSSTPAENPFKDLRLGSVQTDKDKIQKDFDKAVKEALNDRNRAGPNSYS